MIFYFGTFNPIHKGHLQIAKKVEEIRRDEVIFVPAYDSPWKPNLRNNYQHRVNMLKLCNVKYLEVEKELPTPSYTYRTVDYLYEEYGIVNFIIGYDQFFSLPQWNRADILRDLCKFIVIPREGIERVNWKLIAMKEEGYKFKVLPISLIPGSSTEVRNGNLDLVVPAVKIYIQEFNLYELNKI